ncbi:NUDIX hydrolase [Comamonas faecalis]
MQAAPHTLTETPRDAATVIVLRDSSEGLQTLLLRRHAKMANMGGVYVFPGGKLERSDSDASATALLDQPPAQLQAQLGEAGLDAAMAAGLHIAALREALEECGLLLAEPHGREARLDAERARAMLDEGQGFAQVVAQLGLRLATRQLAPWSRWITPMAPALATRRFDTRFFVAQAPQAQQARHDDHETTDSLWIAPRQALQRYRDGAIELAPPQIMSLAQLARHASVASAMAAARAQRPPTILPESFEENGVRVICYPGDPMHPVHQRAMDGPTRLAQQGRRFLPPQGFDALFL